MTTAASEGRILIVDDQRNWRETLGEVLRADGQEVQVASTLAEAQELLASTEFDVAIVDIRLLDERRYDIQGLRFIEEIHHSGVATRTMVLTGYAPPGTELRIQELGAEALALKCPSAGFSITKFRKAVRALVQKARLAPRSS
jgi:ActR/RegA family two-component response regulator